MINRKEIFHRDRLKKLLKVVVKA